MRKRVTQQELMDLGPGHYTQEEYHDCLSKLETVNRLLGGYGPTLKAFAKLSPSATSILDVGCGNGAFTLQLARNYPQAQVVGIDISPDAINEAYLYKTNYENLHKKKLSNLIFEHRPSKQLDQAPQSFDVITSTLVWHHMPDHAIVDFIKRAKTVARKAIIINDLHRHPFAYASFWCLSPFLKNRMMSYDGLLSIRRSFKRNELISYLQAADIHPQQWLIEWKWAFRWIISIACS